jgi:hypothetical protein
MYHNKRLCNFRAPKTFTEKLQYLKLVNRKPEYSAMVDKIEAKKYVGAIIGESHIIKTLAVWECVSDISLDDLPDRFVLKTNHDSKGVIVCKDKQNLDLTKIQKFFRKRLMTNGYWYGREWPYKYVKAKVFAEEYLEDNETGELQDFKFFCFNGEPYYCQVITGRFENETVDFFDMNWIHQDFTGVAKPYKPFSPRMIPCPKTFDLMKESCRLLAKKQPFLRVDFYEMNGELYFGELTFYPASGFGSFSPDEWDIKLGDLIVLPNK